MPRIPEVDVGRAELNYRRAWAQEESKFECRVIAHKLATALGHLPLRQGDAVECARCGESGTARETLAGAVHLYPCRGTS